LSPKLHSGDESLSRGTALWWRSPRLVVLAASLRFMNSRTIERETHFCHVGW